VPLPQHGNDSVHDAIKDVELALGKATISDSTKKSQVGNDIRHSSSPSNLLPTPYCSFL